MTNFKIIFSNPWLLLLLIPAIGLTLLTYFRMNKRYRFTRNHITSIVLHMVIMVLSIAVLAGMIFGYSIPNNDNEIILLVDASYSTSDSEDEVDEFIRDVIDSTDTMFELGIVTFGFDQVYASELSSDTSETYTNYIKAELPDTTATDIASALTYTSTLFRNPESAKIVLITDAIETDGAATNVIKSISAQGIMVDTVYFPDDQDDNKSEVQLNSLAEIKDKIVVGQKFNFDLSLQSSYEGSAKITPYDNGVAGEAIEINLKEGVQTVTIPYAFVVPGMHVMSFEIESEDDTLTQNNTYLSYFYLDIYDKILVIESIENESASLCDMLKDELNVKVLNIEDTENLPKTVDDLRAYDEVILCNISNENMPEGFDQILFTYVNDIGGGLFTVCGNKETPDSGDEWTANAYTFDDMNNTLYQQMLPLQAINYTPPVAVMIIIDTSGSMWYAGQEKYEESKLYYAQQGAEACLSALSERDYVGVMTLGTSFSEEIELTPRTQREKILSAIALLSEKEENLNGGTNFSLAFERAGKALLANTSVERRHIIVVTDGEPGDTEKEYGAFMKENAEAGITMSIVGVQASSSAETLMKKILVEYANVPETNFHNVTDIEQVPEAMREDLEVPEIKDVNYKPFTPKIANYSLVVNGIEQENMPELDGFYGVKAKKDATVILMGEYTPIYAEWKLGRGRVGSFACDLNGTWSADFISSTVGATIVNNIVTSLFPSENIRTKSIDAEVTGNNYLTQLSVFTDLAEGEIIEAIVTSPATDEVSEKVQTFTAGANEGYSRFTFAVTTPGIHTIVVNRKTADGTVVATTTIQKVLSYSQEYNVFADTDVAAALCANLAKYGDGEVINTAYEVFDDATKYFERTYDPKIPFIIAVIVLFLLDVAVRKFKFKWIHEIIRDRKKRQAK
ncbi:MAG: VWA domain-containing protein [Clostridia bacterium]|nr:VWA domain-containing protein [Clostridia bacterium]